jgi:hypothetical protein
MGKGDYRSSGQRVAETSNNVEPPPCQGITPNSNGTYMGRRIETRPDQLDKHEFWDSFRDYLQSQNNRTTANDRINYAKKYYTILVNNDPSEILPLSFAKRIHIMKASTAFTGIYKIWQDIIDLIDFPTAYVLVS